MDKGYFAGLMGELNMENCKDALALASLRPGLRHKHWRALPIRRGMDASDEQLGSSSGRCRHYGQGTDEILELTK